MDPTKDIERLKSMALADDEDPTITTVDPQIRTTKFTMFPEPKGTPEDEPGTVTRDDRGDH